MLQFCSQICSVPRSISSGLSAINFFLKKTWFKKYKHTGQIFIVHIQKSLDFMSSKTFVRRKEENNKEKMRR